MAGEESIHFETQYELLEILHRGGWWSHPDPAKGTGGQLAASTASKISTGTAAGAQQDYIKIKKCSREMFSFEEIPQFVSFYNKTLKCFLIDPIQSSVE